MITYNKALDKPQQLKGGATLILTVNIAGSPTPTVSWTFDDAELTVPAYTSLETTDAYSTLTIKGVTGNNTGVFKVTAENEAGSDSAEFTVTVKGMELVLIIARTGIIIVQC